ncbi:MAG: phosphoglycerate mutase (2,3-diphosphoglycerate-independent) [Parcubacteria group bacterium CG1_02_37_51]|uniref:2,3-bisphosphoglycerate-independent phosphoglycerate mutase n=2 Tax=Candidatus Komeiliibacteriota TaxID=1817908 RepID=A0A2M8DS77_9BACT|nr:MAG: phosphoglycerate mutase (2,3-diphosphoglycerate-independent) [Parcubacteria group bacterium CG1_02_37_51]PIY93948.1 MAG: 2,3-bisphosphoglycerate-independent phosphoglycerate mutase [Candidatus Komeilibacteria bacterium CG_4_10_14_0_8_um_filter_37_78]PJC02237.1 MAG: 2,3-bisphosphoglycerate-independent phosphoglycerate mutase [Candidatus Komeilibacteria bacterium CG_4_9_14_0_8_um_filter_36_9]
MTKQKKNTPLVLAILDGWGLSKPNKGNAITLAKTPNFDRFWKEYSHTKLKASGKDVGLPRNQFGNSEAGHLNLGAGRVVKQDSLLINNAIDKGRFSKNSAFLSAIRHVKTNKSTMHLMGLLSGSESAHAERKHIFALLDLLAREKVGKICIHLFTDGRDAPQHAAINFINDLTLGFKNGEQIVSIMGRFYAMDRNKHWERTEEAYDLLTLGQGHLTTSAKEAIIQAYNRNETDEFLKPTAIAKDKKTVETINTNDVIIFYNLRSDRGRQLAKCFVQADFNKMNLGSFKRKKVLKNIRFVAMTDFGPDLGDILSAYPSEDIKDTLPMALKDLRQLYISESEKFAHVTYFFNGGYADHVGGESRLMIPSPNVRSYAEKPEMSIVEMTKELVKYIKTDSFDFICVNYPNPDMVGHTGNLQAGIKAVEAVDQYLAILYDEIKKKNGTLMIVADHGNIEEMIDLETGEIDTEHSANLVPLIIVSSHKYRLITGALANVAPTILEILELPKGKLMTAKSLIK